MSTLASSTLAHSSETILLLCGVCLIVFGCRMGDFLLRQDAVWRNLLGVACIAAPIVIHGNLSHRRVSGAYA